MFVGPLRFAMVDIFSRLIVKVYYFAVAVACQLVQRQLQLLVNWCNGGGDYSAVQSFLR